MIDPLLVGEIILFPYPNVKRAAKTSKPFDTMQDKTLSLTFFSKQRKKKREYQLVLMFRSVV